MRRKLRICCQHRPPATSLSTCATSKDSGPRCLLKKAIESRVAEQVWRDTMSFFERLKTGASAEWRAYTEHPFIAGLKATRIYPAVNLTFVAIDCRANSHYRLGPRFSFGGTVPPCLTVLPCWRQAPGHTSGLPAALIFYSFQASTKAN
jgi:hypothetical protein